MSGLSLRYRHPWVSVLGKSNVVLVVCEAVKLGNHCTIYLSVCLSVCGSRALCWTLDAFSVS
jgi:hypothetical protein